MKAKTELLLYHIMWATETLARPTYRGFSGSFESWAYRNGFLQRIHALEQADLLESKQVSGSLERVYRLTREGVKIALGGRNPETQWQRSWDGKWRFILFDLPESQRSLRSHLRHTLHKAHFGCLQRSVWLSPDPIDSLRQEFKRLNVDAATLTLIEGLPCGGESGIELATSAWPFQEINGLYKQHRQHLAKLPPPKTSDLPSRLKQWMEMERLIWSKCMAKDPLLPECLLPPAYEGKTAWAQRTRTMRKAGNLLRSMRWDQPAK